MIDTIADIHNMKSYSQEMQDSIEPITHTEKKKEVILIGSDHRGFDLKLLIREHLVKDGYDVMDVGTHDKESCDYPNVAQSLIKTMDHKKGILICGSGFGMSIAANRHEGVHAVTPRTVEEAIISRQHGNVNVLCIGSDFTADVEAVKIVDAFLNTAFLNEEKYTRRIEAIDYRTFTYLDDERSSKDYKDVVDGG